MELIKFDYSKLRGRIKEVMGAESKFALEIGISTVTLSSKLNNKTGFSESEIYKACEVLKINAEEIKLYFFCKST